MFRGRLHCFVKVDAAIVQDIQRRRFATFLFATIVELQQLIRLLSGPCFELELKFAFTLNCGRFLVFKEVCLFDLTDIFIFNLELKEA